MNSDIFWRHSRFLRKESTLKLEMLEAVLDNVDLKSYLKKDYIYQSKIDFNERPVRVGGTPGYGIILDLPSKLNDAKELIKDSLEFLVEKLEEDISFREEMWLLDNPNKNLPKNIILGINYRLIFVDNDADSFDYDRYPQYDFNKLKVAVYMRMISDHLYPNGIMYKVKFINR